MPPRQDDTSGAGDQSAQGASAWREDDGLPLVIVSGHGRHTAASRRIVRAQAARASAAQSRETRARNREDRQSRGAASPIGAPSIRQFRVEYLGPYDQQIGTGEPLPPLMHWIVHAMGLPARSLSASGLEPRASSRPARSEMIPDNRNVGDDARSQSARGIGERLDRRLPTALPRGFAILRDHGDLSEPFLINLSRAACFDFASPGGQQRLDNLLLDIATTLNDSTTGDLGQVLRAGTMCVTIFQSQRVDEMQISHDHRYNAGLEAAWREGLMLDINTLEHRDAAEAALWALVMLSVTAAAPNTVHPVLPRLLRDLRLESWQSVRELLLRYIFPVSFLDQTCRTLYEGLNNGQLG